MFINENGKGCNLVYKKDHDRKCEACTSNSATLYTLTAGPIKIDICPICKASIESDIKRINGPDCY